MRVIRPLTITPTQLLSTTAVETLPTWSAATTYALGAQVVYQQSVYESLQNSNTNQQPDIRPLFWLRKGPSNRWAMFDTEVNTQTTASSPLIVSVQPGKAFTSAAFVNISANNLNVKVFDAPAPTGVLVFERNIDLDDTIITDWFDYFFEEFDIRDYAFVDNIPPYNSGVLTATFTSGSPVAVGSVVIGKIYEIGYTQYGLSYGIRDYSVKETNEFGRSTLVIRNFSKRMEPTVMVENNRLNQVGKILETLRAIPTVWIASEDTRFQGSIVYGFYKDYNIDISYPTNSLVRLEIEGLT